MRILGFAHLTFALPSSIFPLPFESQGTFQHIENAKSKLALMKNKDETHNLQLIGGDLELTYYDALNVYHDKASVTNLIQNYIVPNKEIYIENINIRILEILNFLAPQAIFVKENSLKIKGVGTLRDITLTKSDSGLRFTEFLDEVGPTALGFYVDQLDQNFDLCVRDFSTSVSILEPFTLRVGSNTFNIQFAKIGEINFEFLQRKSEYI
jgi:hypothetical protein